MENVGYVRPNGRPIVQLTDEEVAKLRQAKDSHAAAFLLGIATAGESAGHLRLPPKLRTREEWRPSYEVPELSKEEVDKIIQLRNIEKAVEQGLQFGMQVRVSTRGVGGQAVINAIKSLPEFSQTEQGGQDE